MRQSLSGPSHLPASGNRPDRLVVLLHGYGADGADLISLAPLFAQALPTAEFVAPNAPARCEMGFGYQWFGLREIDPVSMAAGVREAAPVLDGFIDDALANRGLGPDRLALVGFSQGTMMALDRALRRPEGQRAIVGFSGMVASAVDGPIASEARPPILLIHGTADPVVPFASLAGAETVLARAGFPVETMARPGLGHGIDGEGAERAAVFLARHFGLS
ncbi:MAG TPA: prolyl oligopeptidase family serine peptidase [Alphaproteobacteria bacterium]|nr:prolyl oligopeptidase family serine peptidase [Alphaproteobacteria bacterium]